MNEWIFIMLIGHFFGDFLMQPWDWAKNKKENNLDGWIGALSHCLYYTFIVTLSLYFIGKTVNNTQFIMIYLTHFIIDKFPIIETWLKIGRVRSWDTFLPKKSDGEIDWDANITVKEAVTTSFGSIVYVVSDNTIHILSLYLIIKLL